MIGFQTLREISIGYLCADLTRLFGRVFDRRAAHLGLTRVQWRTLKHIQLQEGLTQSELSDMLDMEPIAVGRVIDRLQRAGFVERHADSEDRRCWRLQLSPRALDVTDAIEAVAIKVREDIVDGVDPAELAVTFKVLNQISDNLLRLDRHPAVKIPPLPTAVVGEP